MTELVFYAKGDNAGVTLADSLTLAIERSDHAPILAAHENGSWRIGNLNVERMLCRGPIHITIEASDLRRTFGPFTELVIGDDLIGTREGVFARYVAKESVWHVTPGDRAPISLGRGLKLLAA